MNDTPKVSILVPAYNVDTYIGKFLDSLVNQTLKEIEIIIVNDASPDKCHDIIGKFMGDKRIKYINKKVNEGLWKARQSAYEIATGEYVINLDPDDFIDTFFLERLYTFGKEHGLDIVQSNVKIIDENDREIGNSTLKSFKRKMVLQKPEDYRILLGTPYASWFRLVKREVLKKFEYNYLKGELIIFAFQFCDSIKVGIQPDVSYYYRKHSTSLSNYNKSAKRISENQEFGWDNILQKANDLRALPISSAALRSIFNIYAFRVLYSLTMISWLVDRPSKEYRNKIGTFFKTEFGLTLQSYLKNVLWFKKNDQIFLTLCFFNLDVLVLIELKRRFK